MRRCALLALLCIQALWVAADGPSSAPAAPPAQADRLAVESLNHSARSLGHLRDDAVVARAGRIRALLRHALSLWPDDAQTNRQLVDLYEGLGELSSAAAAADRYLRARPEDCAVGLRWMRLAQATLSGADERIALLTQAAERKELPPEVRAAAWAELCRVYQRQGERAKAAAACEQALALDALEPTALAASVRLEKDPGPAETFQATLGLFRTNPRSLHVAWRLAQTLQAAGAYGESLRFFEHAWAVAREKPPAPDVAETLVLDHVNAALDAGLPAKAAELFEPLIKDYGYSLALRTLMVEAYRALKNDKQADAQVALMARVYQPQTAAGAKLTAEQAAELGWFNLTCRSQAQAALVWAKLAVGMPGGDGRFVQRVLGAAEVSAGADSVEAGAKRLAALAGKDVSAAAILARHFYAGGNPRAGREVLLKAPMDVRTGPAWRQLAAVAAEYKADLPPLPHAPAMVRGVAELPKHVFELGRSPERFVAVSLSAREKVAPGEPVDVTVELANVSQYPVSLGPDGLLAPVVSLSVAIDGEPRANLEGLTPAHLPGPKYLLPGRKVSATVRVDIGPAERLLMDHPLAELKLTVTAMVDPLEHGRKMISSVPTLKVAPITIRRSGLVAASGGPTAARYALAFIVRDLQQGAPPAQLRAARQTASLLARARRVELGKAGAIYPEVLTKPVLLSMMRAFLQDASPAVRAEMLASLHHVDLDARIIGLLGPNVQDASPLVRMRLIELLAGKRTNGYETLLELFAKDPSAAVREMAAAVGGAK